MRYLALLLLLASCRHDSSVDPQISAKYKKGTCWIKEHEEVWNATPVKIDQVGKHLFLLDKAVRDPIFAGPINEMHKVDFYRIYTRKVKCK